MSQGDDGAVIKITFAKYLIIPLVNSLFYFYSMQNNRNIPNVKLFAVN